MGDPDLVTSNGPVYGLCIVGAGMVGSSAARHASAIDGMKVCVIGPQEPKSRICKTGKEIFGAHYDQARITRTTGEESLWATLARRSIERYRELEQKSGVRFFENVGIMNVGKGAIDGLVSTSDHHYSHYPSNSELQTQLPYMNFLPEDHGLFDPQGGWINPRKFISAQMVLALNQGCDVIRDIVCKVEKVHNKKDGSSIMRLKTEGGHVIYAEKVLLATNVFTTSRDLLGDVVPKFEAIPGTVVLAEVDSEDVQKLKGMPTIWYGGKGYEKWNKDYSLLVDGMCFFYMLPPILYPDGKYYIKLGRPSPEPINKADIAKWYCSDGDPTVFDNLSKLITGGLFKDVNFKSLHPDTCVLMRTPTLHPYIDKIHEQLGVAIGCNGWAAKSGDELGRVAVQMMTSSQWSYDFPQDDFKMIVEDS